MTNLFSHSLLGDLKGILRADGRVTQFRAVPFARVPARFRQSVMLESLDDSSRDFTQWGPVCPQIHDPQFMDGKAFGGPLSPENYTFDEFNCLNLTITVPSSALSDPPEHMLPVLVWVHGGGLQIGGGANFGLEDCARIVDQSLSMGKPVMTVALQYRLGPLGFLASKELVEEAKKNNENPGNYGLWDVIHGFDWINKFISGFHGDAHNITSFGESAGGVILSYLIISKGHGRKLFKRAILQSGVANVMALTTAQKQQPGFDDLYKNAVVNKPYFPSAADKIDGLRQVTAEDILKLNPHFNTSFRIMVDGVLFTELVTVDQVAELTYQCDWIDGILLGDCKFEGGLSKRLAAAMLSKTRNPNHVFGTQLTELYGPESSKRLPGVLDAFGLAEFRNKSATKLAMTASAALQYLNSFLAAPTVEEAEVVKVCELIGALWFHAQIYRTARWNGEKRFDVKTYYYHFDKTNPFPGDDHHGTSHHFLDVIYLFKNTIDRILELPDVKRSQDRSEFESSVSYNFAAKWITFANAEEPWEHDKVGVIGGSSSDWTVLSDDEDAVLNERKLEAWKCILGTDR